MMESPAQSNCRVELLTKGTRIAFAGTWNFRRDLGVRFAVVRRAFQNA
jgi:hypothetical protein